MMMPSVKVGDESLALNGLKMKIINYSKSNDIDVEFEDGVIVKHKSVKCFLQGYIRHPGISVQKMGNRVGMQKEQLGGHIATIIEYTDARHILVQFEDGSEKMTAYNTFKRGIVKHNEIRGVREPKDKERIGLTSKMNCGLSCTITKYNSVHDMTVVFEHGVERRTTMKEFKAKQINCGYPYRKGHTKEVDGFKCTFAFKTENNTYYKVKHKDGFEGIMTPQEMIAYNK